MNTFDNTFTQSAQLAKALYSLVSSRLAAAVLVRAYGGNVFQQNYRSAMT